MTESNLIAFFQKPEIPAFNAAMLADPDNDLPRLVFADWVEENCPHTPFVMALRRSIANPEIPEWVPNFSMVIKGHELRLWRGRIEVGIDMSDPDYDTEPDEFVKAAWESSWAGRLKFRGMQASYYPHDIANRLDGIEWLDLFDAGEFSALLYTLLAATSSTDLRVLDVRLNRVASGYCHVLATSRALSGLKELRVSPEYLDAPGRRHLAESKTLPEHIRAQFRRPA